MRIRVLLTFLVFVVMLGVGVPTAFAAPRDVCVSNGTGNWGTASIWSCNHTPTNSDIVIINNNHTVTLDTDGVAYQLIVGGGTSGTLTHDGNSRTLTVGAGGVSVSNGGTFDAPSTLTIAGNLTNYGTFTGSSTVTVNGNLMNNSTFSTGNLSLTGNLTNNGGFNVSTTVTMNGTAAQSISGNNLTFVDLTINNTSTSGVTLNTNATVINGLTLNSDLIVTAGYVLTMDATSYTSGNADVVGKVRRTSFWLDNERTFGSAYTAITFTGWTTPPSEIVVELFKTAPGGLANAVQRYYSITPTGGSGYIFTLRLHYRDSELNGIPENDLQMWQQVNGRWTLRARTSNDTTNNWVEKTGLTSFSLWALSNIGAPTAVNLSSFDARADAPNVVPLVGLGMLAMLALGIWRWRD